MQAKALRLAMDYAIIALNGMNFDTSLASVKTEDIPRIASDICANGRGRLAALLTAESERDELREVFDAAAKERHGASGMCCQLRDHVVKERDQLRAELASLRSNIGVLYEWIQGNTSLTGKQKEAANCIFDQLDKGVKEDSGLRAELATIQLNLELTGRIVLARDSTIERLRAELAYANDAASKGEAGRKLSTALEEALKELSTAKVEIEKWKLGCETNADCYKAAVREQDNQRLELLKAKAENAALRDVARAADQVRILLGPPNLATGLKPLADALRALAEKGVVLDERKD